MTDLVPDNESRPLAKISGGILADPKYRNLADMPPEAEWFANIDNLHTRRAYRNDVSEFARFVGMAKIDELRLVARGHVLAWRDDLNRRGNSAPTIRRKLSALASLFDYLNDQNAVAINPVDGVRRPSEGSNEGKTPAISDAQARRFMDSPPSDSVKGLRDRAIIACFLYSAMRAEELTRLKVKSLVEIRGALYFRVRGKRNKIRNIIVHPIVQTRIFDYLAVAGHGEDKDGSLFRPVKNNTTGRLRKHMETSSVFRIIRHYGILSGLKPEQIHPHVMRATAITNALENGADIAKVQEWAGHANISTTRLYDRRQSRPEDSPANFLNYLNHFDEKCRLVPATR